MLFFRDIFHLLVEQTKVYYQQHLDRQAGPSRPLPDITLPDMMTFVALALQTGHELKDTLHDYWSKLGSYAIRFMTRRWHKTDFYTYCDFYILHTIHRDLTKAKNMTDCGNLGLSLTN